jgi:CheY-like chemotaxis protein
VLNTIPSLAAPIVVLVLVVFLLYRMGLLAGREIEGRGWFVFGGVLVFLAAGWQAVKITPDYGQWFVPTVYPVIELVQFLTMVAGVTFMVVSIALYADFWQTRREELELRQAKLSILENLQHDARQPYHLLEMLNISLREILVHLPMAAGGILFVNRNRRQFVLASFSGLTKNETALLEYYPLGRNIVSQSLELGDPLLASQFDFFDRSGKPVRSRFGSCLILPMASGLEKIGVLLLFAEERNFFSRADIRYLNPVVQWLAEKIKSARLTRELAQTTQKVDQHVSGFSQVVSRFSSASRAMAATEALTMFCRSLAGLASAGTVHLCGLKQGNLVFHGGSEPLYDISENYKTALMEAIDSPKPLIINQESSSGEGRPSVVLSSLVYPLPSQDSRDALLFRRQDRRFEVDEDDLKQMESFANLAVLVLRSDEHHRLSLARRQGVDAVLQLLKADRRPGKFADDPGYFLKHLAGVLPPGSVCLAFVRDERGVCGLAEAVGLDEFVAKAGPEVLPGEGGVGKAAANREAVFLFGRSQVARHMEAYDDTNRAHFQRLFGERDLPVFIACNPILTGRVTSGVIMTGIFDLDESGRGEWERLLTLATGLYSLRLSMDELEAARTSPQAEEVGLSYPGSLINRINNHLSAVLGTAELAAQRPDLSGEVRAQLEQIVHETEQAADSLKDVLTATPYDESSGATSADSLNQVIQSVLTERHVSGDLYMAGQRPREIKFKLDRIGPVPFSDLRMRSLFESVLDRFASSAEEEDVITIATYLKDDHAYLDISRHRHNFPPVEKVAFFGRYEHCEAALRNRPADVYLKYLIDSESSYAVDSSSSVPAYISFRIPVRRGTAEFPDKGGNQAVKLLAIDDQAVILDLISAMGQSLGYHVATALSGEEGLRLSEQEQFDIVLTDLALPGLSGLEVARRLRQLHPRIPIILVTGWEAGLDQSQLESAGISRVLYKPFRIEQLTEIVQTVVASPSSA